MAARRGSAIPLVIAGLLGLVLILAVRQWVGGDGDEEAGHRERVDDDHPCPRGLHHRVGRGVQREGRPARQAGRAVQRVRPAGRWRVRVDGGVHQGQRRGDHRPRPRVGRGGRRAQARTCGRPASSSWAGLVDQGATDLDRPSPMPKERPSLVQTPLVIAMPLPMAQALGWPDAQIGWKDLAAIVEAPKGWDSKGHPEWGRFKLGKTNPYFSTSGLNATIAAFFAATGRVQRPHRPSRSPTPRPGRSCEELGILGRPLRRHDADLPGQHEPGGRGRARG